MLIDIPQLVIPPNKPVRDCPSLLRRVLAYIEPTPVHPLLHSCGDSLPVMLEPFKPIGNLEARECP